VADRIRDMVVSLLKKHQTQLNQLSASLPFLLDDKINQSYNSIADRINDVSRSSGYVGYLEIAAASCLLNIQFKIFVRNANSSKYCLMCILPADIPLHCESSTVYLLHQVDTSRNCGHFDLLLGQNTTESARLTAVSESRYASTLIPSSDAEDFGLLHMLSCAFSTAVVSSLNADVLDECVGKSQPKTAGVVSLSLSDQDLETETNVISSEEDAEQGRLQRTTEHGGAAVTAEEDAVGVISTDIPDCWSLEQYNEKKTAYPWLTSSEGLLGCLTCREARSLPRNTSRFSCEWAECRVSAFGDSKPVKQQSLRKKIWSHKTSDAHNFAQKELDRAAQNPLESAIGQHYHTLQDPTMRVFRTAYNIAKKERPFTDLPADVDLQQLNGLNMGRVLHSNVSCADIIDHIAHEMRDKMVADILCNNSKFSLLVDESTSHSHASILVICMRAVVGDAGSPLTFFLDIVELEGADARSIYQAIVKCLKKHGFSDEFLRLNFIGFASDGASNMMGARNGVSQLLLNDYPDLVVWHCANHRLELAVADVVKDIPSLNHVRIFFEKLRAVYHSSPKNRRQLEACSETRVLVVGKILDVRWVASSERSVKALWNGFNSIHNHLRQASVDPARDAREKATFSGLCQKMCAVSFVRNLGLLYDALTELSFLSLELQRRDMTLPMAHRLLCRQIRVFESMANSPGPYVQEVTNATESSCMQFQNVDLHASGKSDVVVDYGQFFVSLANNMKRRLLSTRSSAEPRTSTSSHQEDYQDLIRNIDVLDPATWPQEDLDIQHGDQEVRRLCKRLKVPEEGKTIRAFREFKDTKVTPPGLKALMTAVTTIAISTAECERCFSVMNDILSPIRSSMSVEHTSSLMFIKLVGPPLPEFHPRSYVKSWLSKGRRSAQSTQCMARQKNDEGSNEYISIWKLL